MQLLCPQCSRAIEYSGDRPSFCGYCGNRLAPAELTPPRGDQELAKKQSTAEFLGNTAVTLPPSAIPAGSAVPVAADTEHIHGHEALPQLVGGYRLLKRLGSGGMGSVYEAEDSRSGRHVAVKLIAPGFNASREAVDRFRQEGRLASAIAHPRCVFVLATDEDAGRPYIVMELMPGTTLRDLVSAEGPLPPSRAVALILDVIDGLHEAHENGLIHRDVKPSNCFLQADGRVKVGDFGLAKSLTVEAHLTRTGTFLGTPLFASPEQVRGDRLDPRTDVYSVAATLYYLLAGKAPFEGGDAASTLARIVADPAPSLRALRPEISTGLDRVVLRGLERQRERRWQTMEEFRDALLPFVPGNLSKGGMGIRFGASLLDHLVIMPLQWIAVGLMVWSGMIIIRFDPVQPAQSAWVQVLSMLPPVLYYTLLEGWFGWSVGKWLLNLRVCRTEDRDPPGLARALWRTLVYHMFIGIPVYLAQQIATPEAVVRNPLLAFVTPLSMLLGVALRMCTMRARNGYRGVHEFLSGTRVVMLPWRKRRKKYRSAVERPLLRPEGMPGRIGPYTVLGALRWSDSERILVGEDKALGRKVWVQLRPLDDPPLSHVRRDVSRTTRLRWLASGADATASWDAFLAPRGSLLTAAVAAGGRLTWTEARPLLEDLTDELLAAQQDGTLPERLSVEQIWMQPNGHLQLLDIAMAEPAPGLLESLEPADQASDKTSSQTSDDERRLLALLTKAAVLALEQPSASPPSRKDRIRAPMPLHVARFMNRLVGMPRPYKNLRHFHDDLIASRDQPTEVSRVRRLAHIMVVGFLLLSGIGCCLMPVLLSASVRYVIVLDHHIRSGEKALSDLEKKTPVELAGQLVQPDGWHRVGAAARWRRDTLLRDQLRQRLVEFRGEHELWKEALRWPGSQLVGLKLIVAPPGAAARSGVAGVDAERILAADPRGAVGTVSMLPRLGVVFGVCLAIFIVWAFLWRGGIAYSITGISVVRKDGRKAARWQCAWRAFLFWFPLMALLIVSMSLDDWFWRHGDPHIQGWAAWLPLLSSLVYFATPVTLLGYLVLALWNPTRSWHDRLAGTLLMPR